MSPLLRPERVQEWASRSARFLATGLGAGLSRPLTGLHPALDDAARYAAWLTLPREPPAQPRHRPLISLLMPVFEAPEPYLSLALESLLGQSYDRWELCVADAGPRDSPGSRRLAALARSEPRIRIVRLERNLGIAANSNAALATARGDFVATFDQDDSLDPDALLHMAARLDATPDLDVVYSDMDNVTPGGVRYAPFFKPDWSRELLLSGNYLAHLALFRRELLEAAHGFDPAMDGAQDWDLALRLTDGTDRIAHVPQVLYHWRALPSSAASGLDAKPWAREAQRKAVQAALDRRRLPARAEHDAVGRIRISVRDEAEASGEFVRFEARGLAVPENVWRALTVWAADPAIGAAGPLLLGPDGKVAAAGLIQTRSAALSVFAGASGRRWSPLGWPQWLRDVDAPVPLAFVARREIVDRFGPVDATPEAALAFGRRLAAAGLRCVTVGSAAVVCPDALRPAARLPLEGEGRFWSPNLDPDSPVPRPAIPRSAEPGSSRSRSL